MDNKEYNFQDELKKSIFESDPKLNRSELLVDIFKCYVAKLFERTLTNQKLPFQALVQVKNNLINEFRNTELSEYQKSVEQYEQLFDDTVKEILSLSAMRHDGRDEVKIASQQLEINSDVYIKEKGILKPLTAL